MRHRTNEVQAGKCNRFLLNSEGLPLNREKARPIRYVVVAEYQIAERAIADTRDWASDIYPGLVSKIHTPHTTGRSGDGNRATSAIRRKCLPGGSGYPSCI